jgi:hypothetical protein
MDQKQWEERLDRAAERVSQAVTEGVHVLEDAYVKGKETLKDELNTRRGPTPAATDSSAADPLAGGPEMKPAHKGTVRLGLIFVGFGIVWLLHSLGMLNHPIFPILLIVLGVIFVARAK